MKYRKKPVVVEAFKWTGDHMQREDPEWIVDAMLQGEVKVEKNRGLGNDLHLKIKTLEGVMTAYPGYYIIQGIQGEIYPCKPAIFEATYEAV